MRIKIIAAIAALSCASVTGVASASGTNGIGVVEAVQQTAFASTASAGRAEIHPGDAIAHREVLETTKTGGMMLHLADGSRLTLGADSKAMIAAFAYEASSMSGNAVISIPAGTMRYVTGAMPKGHTIIYTPTATMTLQGTNVTIGVNAQGATHLTIEEGAVSVRSKTTGQETVYHAGQSLDITSDGVAMSTAEATGDPLVDHGFSM